MYLTLSPYAKKILWKKIFFNLKWSSLAVQWLRLCASNAGGTGLISDKVAKTPHAAWYSQKKKKLWCFTPMATVTSQIYLNPKSLKEPVPFNELLNSDQLSCVRLFVTPMDCSTPGFPVHYQLLKIPFKMNS